MTVNIPDCAYCGCWLIGEPPVIRDGKSYCDQVCATSGAPELCGWWVGALRCARPATHQGACHHDPASGPEPAPGAPGTAGVDAGTGEAG